MFIARSGSSERSENVFGAGCHRHLCVLRGKAAFIKTSRFRERGTDSDIGVVRVLCMFAVAFYFLGET